MILSLSFKCQRESDFRDSGGVQFLKVELSEDDFRTGMASFAHKHDDHYHLLEIDRNGAVRDNQIADSYIEEYRPIVNFLNTLSSGKEVVGEYENNGASKEISFKLSPSIYKSLKKGKRKGYLCVYEFQNKDLFRFHIKYEDKNLEVTEVKPVKRMKDYEVLLKT